jgi:hypothetical protein
MAELKRAWRDAPSHRRSKQSLVDQSPTRRPFNEGDGVLCVEWIIVAQRERPDGERKDHSHREPVLARGFCSVFLTVGLMM